MSDLNKVPFGLRVANNEIVDVYDVPRGKNCNCICPSCRTPLVANQGDIKCWYFSHASRKVYEQTNNECEYSFFTSVRLMAKQIIGNKIKLCLPEYIGIVQYYHGVVYHPEYKEFTVTEKQEITIENLEVEKTFSGVMVDIIGTKIDYQFVIYFTHPGRKLPEILYNPENTKCGIIEILLDSLEIQFKKTKSKEKTYQEILTDYLINDIESKKWIFHPNKQKRGEAFIEKLKSQNSNLIDCKIVERNEPLFRQSRKDNLVDRRFPGKTDLHSSSLIDKQLDKMFTILCVICDITWQSCEAEGNQCPQCKLFHTMQN